VPQITDLLIATAFGAR